MTELVRDTETDLLYHHSSRVYYWAAHPESGAASPMTPELLYAGAIFHDMGLSLRTPAPRALRGGRGERRARLPAQPRHLAGGHRHGLDRDRPAHHAGHSRAHAPCRGAGDGRGRDGRPGHRLRRIPGRGTRGRGASAIPRSRAFKQDIIQAFYDGIKAKPETTFGNVKADVSRSRTRTSGAATSAEVILNSKWASWRAKTAPDASSRKRPPRPLSGTVKNKRLLREGPGSPARFAGLRPG